MELEKKKYNDMQEIFRLGCIASIAFPPAEFHFNLRPDLNLILKDQHKKANCTVVENKRQSNFISLAVL